MVEYSGLKSTTRYGVTILSAMLPALSILGLYFEKHLLRRIWIMLGMTFIFGGALAFCTSARADRDLLCNSRVSSITLFLLSFIGPWLIVFNSFAAVEVIFIGTADGVSK